MVYGFILLFYVRNFSKTMFFWICKYTKTLLDFKFVLVIGFNKTSIFKVLQDSDPSICLKERRSYEILSWNFWNIVRKTFMVGFIVSTPNHLNKLHFVKYVFKQFPGIFRIFIYEQNSADRNWDIYTQLGVS